MKTVKARIIFLVMVMIVRKQKPIRQVRGHQMLAHECSFFGGANAASIVLHEPQGK